MEPEVLLLNTLDVYEKLLTNKHIPTNMTESLKKDIETILKELNAIVGDGIAFSQKRRENARIQRMQQSGLTVN